jgi:DNA-binding transcriptional regulator GbsR (MarR family)
MATTKKKKPNRSAPIYQAEQNLCSKPRKYTEREVSDLINEHSKKPNLLDEVNDARRHVENLTDEVSETENRLGALKTHLSVAREVLNDKAKALADAANQANRLG